jgi:uncharacterized ion transporter superfamily protein YfcC
MNVKDKEKHIIGNKKRIKAPDALALMVIFMIIAAILTYILPAGEYTRIQDPNTGRMIVDATSYHSVENSPISGWGLLQAIPKGLNEAAYVMNFLLIIGGVFGIIEGTGALMALIGSTVKKLSGRERLIIPAILIIWGLGGALVGNFEEALAFIPLQIALSLALGFDSLTGMAMAMLGVASGYIASIINPFNVGIAQGIAELPLYSGMQLRLIAFALILGSAIIFLYRYAGKIQKNPELSPVYEQDKNSPYRHTDMSAGIEFTKRQRVVLLVFVLGIAFMVYGVVTKGYYLAEIAAIFVGIGIATGIAGGLGPNKMVEHFVKGATNLLYAAIAVGFARGIVVVMTDGGILDVIVNGGAALMSALPTIFGGVGMFTMQSFINFLVPSGSGQAAVTMPIMVPISDVIGITRQTAVLAFQFGDGLTNLVTPLSGAFMAALSLCKISWGKWLKWFMPLLITWFVICSAILVIAVKIEYGPF